MPVNLAMLVRGMGDTTNIVRLFAPPADLARFVKVIYIMESPWIGIDQFICAWTKPYVAFQYAEPVFSNVNGDTGQVPDVSVSGMVSRRYRFTTPARHIKLCIVEFTPVGLFCLLREHADAFTDSSIDANEVIPRRRRQQICEALEETSDTIRKVEIIHQFLRTLLPQSIPREARVAEHAVTLMERHQFRLRVSDLAAEVDVSERHFRRVFTAVTGLSPKAYQRIERFRLTFHALSDPAGADGLPEFYDQAHMINDFRSFTGYAPGSLPAEQFYFFRELSRPGFGT